MKNYIIILLFVFTSCKKEVYNKIEFNNVSTLAMKDSMTIFLNYLNKTTIDTIAINNEQKFNKLKEFIKLGVLNERNADSIKYIIDTVKFNYYNDPSYFKLKSMYVYEDGIFFLNHRTIGKDLISSMNNVSFSNEMNLLTLKERHRFIKLMDFLNKNDIHSIYNNTLYENIYFFEFKKDYYYESFRYERFLLLNQNLKNNKILTDYDILDEKDGILLLKNK